MAVIKVETPDGVKEVEIAGNEPTPQEAEAIRQTFFAKEQPNVITKKKDWGKSDGFIKGFQKGFGGTQTKLDKLGDIAKGNTDIGQAIKDKLSGKGSDDKGSKDAQGDAKTKGGLRFMSKEMGIENPELAVRGINKIQDGKPLNQRELASLAPIINTIEASLQSQQGRTRLLQLAKMMKKS